MAGIRDNWPTHGGNLFAQRYSPLAEINRGGRVVPAAAPFV